MPLFSNTFAGSINAPVGNNMNNHPNDVIKTKKNFSTEGYYRTPVENGYIDQELDTAIRTFQRDHDLKIDGFMNPSGETEKQLKTNIQTRKYPERPKTGIENVNAAILPVLAYEIAAYLGMSAMAAWAWYNNQPPSVQKDIREKARARTSQSANDIDNKKPHCEDSYAKDTTECNHVTVTKGAMSGAICHASASERYAACRTGKPEREWPNLQK